MENIFQILSTVPDHRRGNHLIYPIDYLLLISFSGIMSGFTTWSDFELYAQLHEEDLKMLYIKIGKERADELYALTRYFQLLFSRFGSEGFSRGLQVLAAHCLGDPRATYLHRWKNNPRGEEA